MNAKIITTLLPPPTARKLLSTDFRRLPREAFDAVAQWRDVALPRVMMPARPYGAGAADYRRGHGQAGLREAQDMLNAAA